MFSQSHEIEFNLPAAKSRGYRLIRRAAFDARIAGLKSKPAACEGLLGRLNGGGRIAMAPRAHAHEIELESPPAK